MLSIPLNNLNEILKINPIIQVAYSEFTNISAHGRPKGKSSLFSENDNKSRMLLYSADFILY